MKHIKKHIIVTLLLLSQSVCYPFIDTLKELAQEKSVIAAVIGTAATILILQPVGAGLSEVSKKIGSDIATKIGPETPQEKYEKLALERKNKMDGITVIDTALNHPSIDSTLKAKLLQDRKRREEEIHFNEKAQRNLKLPLLAGKPNQNTGTQTLWGL